METSNVREISYGVRQLANALGVKIDRGYIHQRIVVVRSNSTS